MFRGVYGDVPVLEFDTTNLTGGATNPKISVTIM
jgi:hypothetical protein